MTIIANRVSDDHVKCPRCWHFTIQGRLNFDGLCDRCARIIVEAFPDHEAAVPIIEAYEAQLVKFTAPEHLSTVKPFWRSTPAWNRYRDLQPKS